MEIKNVFITVTDGDKGWMSFGGQVMDMKGEALDVARKNVLVGYAMSLIPLQKPNKDFKISLAEPEEVDGEKCPGITVNHDNMPTLTIHFSSRLRP